MRFLSYSFYLVIFLGDLNKLWNSVKIILYFQFKNTPEVDPEFNQISKPGYFPKVIINLKLLTIFWKSSIQDIWLGFEYASALPLSWYIG